MSKFIGKNYRHIYHLSKATTWSIGHYRVQSKSLPWSYAKLVLRF